MAKEIETKKKSTTASKTTTKKTASKKTTAKKVATKPAAKKATTKKVETKPAAKKTTTKKVEVKKPTVKKAPAKKVEEKAVVKETIKTKKESKKFNCLEWAKNNINIVGGALIVILLLINIIVVANGHRAKLSNGSEVVASVKGKKVTADELFNSLKEKNGSDAVLNMIDEYIIKKELSDKDKASAKKTASENLESIKKQYTDAGYTWEDVLKQYGYANEDVLLNEFLVSAEKNLVATNYLKSELTEEEIKNYYNKNVYGKYTAKHILIKPVTNDDMSDEDKAAAEETAKNKAAEVIERLNNGEEFDSLVSEYSEDEGSKENNGLVENFTKGDVVDEFFNATAKLKNGAYTTEPVKSEYGYHVIYRVSATKKKALKEIKNDVVDEIVQNKLNEDANLYTTTWVKIRSNYKLTINDSVIKKAYENASK